MVYLGYLIHFGHKNIAGPKVSNWENGYRGFNSVHEMNTELTNKINKYVGEDDTLYHLGDFSFSGGNPKSYKDQLICKNIHIILGNHDKEKEILKSGFLSVQPYKEIYYEKIKICLFHYAMRVWNKHHNGGIHLYGHSHNSIDNNHGKSMDVGVDAIYALKGEYRPISIGEIINHLDNRKIQKIDHHK